MIFDKPDLSLRDGETAARPPPPDRGEAGWGEIFSDSYDAVKLNYELLSKSRSLEDAYNRRIDEIFAATGERLKNPLLQPRLLRSTRIRRPGIGLARASGSTSPTSLRNFGQASPIRSTSSRLRSVSGLARVRARSSKLASRWRRSMRRLKAACSRLFKRGARKPVSTMACRKRP